MKEVKELITTTTEVVKYEAIDGRKFTSKEECEKYDRTCGAIINADFKSLWAPGVEPFNEYQIYENCGYEEDYFALVKINDKFDIEKLNRYIHFATNGNGDNYFVDSSYIGKELIVYIGSYSRDGSYINEMGYMSVRTVDEIVDKLRRSLDKLTTPKKEDENNG